MTTTPSKTDFKDPKTIAKLVIEGRYNEPYIPQGVYAELRIVTTCRFRILKELTNVKKHMQRWLKIYFPEYGNVYRKFDAVSSVIVLETAPLPSDIVVLGADGINKLWRDAKIKAVGIKRAKSLYDAAMNTIGCADGTTSARLEIRLLLEDYRNKMSQYEAAMTVIESLCMQIQRSQSSLKSRE